MLDKRRRGFEGNAIDQVAEKALEELTRGLAPEEKYAFLKKMRSQLGELLSSAPSNDGDQVEDMSNRAKLAAAFRVKTSKNDD